MKQLRKGGVGGRGGGGGKKYIFVKHVLAFLQLYISIIFGML